MPEQVEPNPQAPQNPPAQAAGLSEDATCGLAYVTFIPAIIFLATAPYNQNAKVRFHSWQSIFLAAAWIAIWVCFTVIHMVALTVMPYLILITGPLSLIVWLGFVVLWLVVMINAFNGKMIKLPVIAAFAAKQAGM